MTCALRTAFTKGGKGGFKDTAGADLLAGVFKALLNKSGVDPSVVQDIAVGSVLAPGGGATEFRAAALVAGFPASTAVKSLNRQCSSGLQAIADIANAIQAGMIDVGIGAGVESMSSQYGYASSPGIPSFDTMANKLTQTGCRDRVLRPPREPPRGRKLQSPHGCPVREHGQGPWRHPRFPRRFRRPLIPKGPCRPEGWSLQRGDRAPGREVDRPQDWRGEDHYREGRRRRPRGYHRRVIGQDQARLFQGRLHPRW